jgi:hypothetical protein
VQDRVDEQRLRLAHQIASLIAEKDNPGVVQAWFQGLNPQLDDRSPARLLRDGELDDAGPKVLTAARAFAAPADRRGADLDPELPQGDVSLVTNPGTVWRVGYRPEPWTWTPWQYAENGRFNGRWDDPDGNYRTLYTGQDPARLPARSTGLLPPRPHPR